MDLTTFWSLSCVIGATAWYATYNYILPFSLNGVVVMCLPSHTMVFLGLTNRKPFHDGILDEPEEELQSTLMQIGAWTSTAFLFAMGFVQINGYSMGFPERCVAAVLVAAVSVLIAGTVAKACGFAPAVVPMQLKESLDEGIDAWRRRLDAKTEAALRKACKASCYAYLSGQEMNNAWRNEAFF